VNALILALGTRGDLELFLLLARALQDQGHRVHLVTSGYHAGRVQATGVPCTPIGRSEHDVLERVLASLGSVSDLRTRTRAYVERFIRPELAAATPMLERLSATADYFVSNLKITITREGRILPTAFVTYDPPASLDELDRYSASLDRRRILELVAFPRRLIDPQSRWPSRFHFTGFWYGRSHATRLPQDVADFLRSDPAPIILTTGSMKMVDLVRLSSVFAEALARTHQRGIVINSPQQSSSPSLLHTGEVPYDLLFPQSAAVIHHGGSGTAALALLAGKLSIVLPQVLAQCDMGKLLAHAGACAGVFDPATLTAETLANALQDSLADVRYSQSASGLREAMLHDGGVQAAVAAIERHTANVES
jgi:UDP:flavonoid glycosyltransferase YjiC (YdhE family)